MSISDTDKISKIKALAIKQNNLNAQILSLTNSDTPSDPLPEPEPPIIVEPEPPVIVEPVPEPIPEPVEPPVIPTPPIVVNPPLSQYIRPEPLPRADWMAAPTTYDQEIYVSSTGVDTASGTMANPLKTIVAAVKKAQSFDINTSVNIRLKRGETHIINELFWIKGKNFDLYKPCLLSDYGSGVKPVFEVIKGGFAFESVRCWYFRNLTLDGRRQKLGAQGFQIWDNCDHFMWDNVTVRGVSLAYNISAGRKLGEPEDDNRHFALLNSTQEECDNSGVYTEVGDLFIDNNLAQKNGSNWRGRNYYLAGNEDRTFNVTLQNSASYANCPTIVKDANGEVVYVNGAPLIHGGASPHYTTHGWIDGLNIIDTEFSELEQDMTHGGCWGAAVDEGRLGTWGQEKFRNLVIVGCSIDYTGNQNISVSNAENPLIGWNTLKLNHDARGMQLPGKNQAEHDYIMKKARVWHNDITIPSNSIGILDNIEEADLQYNILRCEEGGKGIVKHGLEFQGDALGTNIRTSV